MRSTRLEPIDRPHCQSILAQPGEAGARTLVLADPLDVATVSFVRVGDQDLEIDRQSMVTSRLSLRHPLAGWIPAGTRVLCLQELSDEGPRPADRGFGPD